MTAKTPITLPAIWESNKQTGQAHTHTHTTRPRGWENPRNETKQFEGIGSHYARIWECQCQEPKTAYDKQRERHYRCICGVCGQQIGNGVHHSSAITAPTLDAGWRWSRRLTRKTSSAGWPPKMWWAMCKTRLANLPLLFVSHSLIRCQCKNSN